jgi:hypothetical protein
MDMLVIENSSRQIFKLPGLKIQAFVAKYHTTTEQLAERAGKAKPKLLVSYQTISFPGDPSATPLLIVSNGSRKARSIQSSISKEGASIDS